MNPDMKALPAEPKEEKAPEKKLTREQQRHVEQVEKAAFQTLKMLSDRYFNFFMQSDDPEGPEVEAKKVQLSSQWKAYCFRNKLTKEAFGIFDADVKAITAVYLASKKQVEPAPDLAEESITEEHLAGNSQVETVSPEY